MSKQWIKAAGCDAGTCVEVAHTDLGLVYVRDSKNLKQEPLVFTAQEWQVFLDGVRDGQFDPEAS